MQQYFGVFFCIQFCPFLFLQWPQPPASWRQRLGCVDSESAHLFQVPKVRGWDGLVQQVENTMFNVQTCWNMQFGWKLQLKTAEFVSYQLLWTATSNERANGDENDWPSLQLLFLGAQLYVERILSVLLPKWWDVFHASATTHLLGNPLLCQIGCASFLQFNPNISETTNEEGPLIILISTRPSPREDCKQQTVKLPLSRLRVILGSAYIHMMGWFSPNVLSVSCRIKRSMPKTETRVM